MLAANCKYKKQLIITYILLLHTHTHIYIYIYIYIYTIIFTII